MECRIFKTVVRGSGQICFSGVKIGAMALSEETKILVRNLLKKLSIEEEVVEIYLALLGAGEMTVLELSRKTKISRTQVYRFCEKLHELNLVTVDKKNKSATYIANNIDYLESYFISQQAHLQEQQEFSSSLAEVLKSEITNIPKVFVREFSGISGLKHANWNLTKATDQFYVVQYAYLNDHLDQEFTRRCREEYIKKDLQIYDINNHKEHNYAGLEPIKRENMHMRHISKEVLDINFELYIYDNVVTLLDYRKSQPWVLEIVHETFTKFAMALFQTLWSISKPVTFVDE